MVPLSTRGIRHNKVNNYLLGFGFYTQDRNSGKLECHVCGRDASTGEIVRALDVLFHPGCFKCCQCGRPLASSETGFNSDEAKNIYCKECYHK